MSVLVATTSSPEGAAALAAGAAEAALRNTSLLWCNVGSTPVDAAATLGDTPATEVSRNRDQDPADAVLDAVAQHQASLLVVGMKRRSPVGKLIMGSLAQRLLLDVNVPVLAVKSDRA